ncbi:copper resistance CopC family protein [Demequina zhanjiangensis]|uniref:Copper resistance protein CopC n=1 Tax=Demequina zhanjiangensis TaxID=3051659 RepID=A0ABT8G0G5_9MICO|nr:copper resistance CopC family protein [Demequina sp. SYSU T00b26]MDN4472449.1 copper resistance protein CopC [Demequina sp. SYSU T00b26]
MRSRLLRPILVLLLALAAVVPGTAASAHTSLSSTDPEQGAEVSDLEQVTLTFTGAVLDLGTTLVLVQGEERVELEPTFPTETTVVADVPELASGAWSLMYRIVAEDGHPLEGQVDFTVAGGAAEPTAEATETAEAALPSTSAEPAPISAELPSASASPEAVQADEPRTGGWVRFAGAAVLVAVAAAVIVWLRRRDASGPAGDDAAEAPRGEGEA